MASLVSLAILPLLALTGSLAAPEDQPAIFYPFGDNEGDERNPKILDSSSGPHNLSTPFPFFGNTYDSLYVNMNGLISFRAPVGQFVPDPFPLPEGDNRPMIAPFWTDIDLRFIDGGEIYYRQTTDVNLLSRAREDVLKGFPTLGNFSPSLLFIATWDRVAFYFYGIVGEGFFYEDYENEGNDTDLPTARNSFQVVLVTDGLRSFALYNYGDIEWRSSTDNDGTDEGIGGNGGNAGFYGGDGESFFTIPGSLTDGILNVEHTTNVGEQGRWLFRTDQLGIASGGCEATGSILAIGPLSGSFLGGYKITVAGPCLEQGDEVRVTIDNQQVTCDVANGMTASCIVPPILRRRGRVPVYMEVNGETNHVGIFNVVDNSPMVELEMNEEYKAGESPATISWNSGDIESDHLDVDLVAFASIEGEAYMEAIPIATLVDNAGSLNIPSNLIESEPFYWVETGAFRVRAAGTNQEQNAVAIWSSIHYTKWYQNIYIYESALTNLDKRRKRDARERKARQVDEILWYKAKDLVQDLIEEAKETLNDVVKIVDHVLYKLNIFNQLCTDWYDGEVADQLVIDVEPCPCEVRQITGNFELDPGCNQNSVLARLGCFVHHQGAHQCFRSFTPSTSGAGQQCCYNEEGNILPAELGGGTFDRIHYKGLSEINFDSDDSSLESQLNVHRDITVHQVPENSHFQADVVPFWQCCILSDNCDKYYEKRPTDNCSDFTPPWPAWTGGDPHITTLDGLRYTLNIKGEVLLTTIPDTFTLQGRAESIENDGVEVPATVWTAFAMHSLNPASDTVQVEAGGVEPIRILINGILEEFYDILEQEFTGVKVKTTTDLRTADITFDSGIYMQVTCANNGVLNMMFLLPDVFRGLPRGLLGDFDGDLTNDLKDPDDTEIDHESSLVDIHQLGILWFIEVADSLFTYSAGTSYASYKDENFSPLFNITPTPEALELCGDDSFECVYDFLTTNDESIALATQQNIVQYLQVLDNTEPVLTCGFLPTPANGFQHFTGSSEGSTVRFSCKDGFQLQGSEERTCMGTGQWSGTDAQCENIDECNDNACGNDDHVHCNDTIGSYTCYCDEQYTWNATEGLCEDLNECKEEIDNCVHLCNNYNGGFNCSCHSGYVLLDNGYDCGDKDECSSDDDACEDISNSHCKNSIGSFTCLCNYGFIWRENICKDVNECTEELDNCTQQCNNIPGGFNCSCYDGYVFSEDEHNCRDDDECATDDDICEDVPNSHCDNTIGSFRCLCNDGFVWSENMCNDINECRKYKNLCDQQCNNLPGGYDCSCDKGYRLVGTSTCADVDECTETPDVCNQTCTNTDGSYICSCRNGYELNSNGRDCMITDICVIEELYPCEQLCDNSQLTYQCDCFHGYKLNDDSHTCQVVMRPSLQRMHLVFTGEYQTYMDSIFHNDTLKLKEEVLNFVRGIAEDSGFAELFGYSGAYIGKISGGSVIVEILLETSNLDTREASALAHQMATATRGFHLEIGGQVLLVPSVSNLVFFYQDPVTTVEHPVFITGPCSVYSSLGFCLNGACRTDAEEIIYPKCDCDEGFVGDACDVEADDDDTNLSLILPLVVTAAVILLIITLLLICWFRICRRRHVNTTKMATLPSANQVYSPNRFYQNPYSMFGLNPWQYWNQYPLATGTPSLASQY